MAIVAGTKLIYDGMGGGGTPRGAYVFKGSVDTYDDLEAISDAWTEGEKEANAGWVYNVADTGKNYAWNGESWDSIGGDFAGSGSINITSSGGNNVLTVAGAPGALNGTFPVSNGSGSFTWRKPQVSDLSDVTATATELNYIDGVTSGIQDQLDSKVSKSGDSLTQSTWGETLTTHTINSDLYDEELEQVVGSTTLGWKEDPTESGMVAEHLVTLPMADTEGGVKYVYTDITGALNFVDKNNKRTKYTLGKIVGTTTVGGMDYQVNYSLPSKTTDSTLATTSDIGNATITFKANGAAISGQSFTTNAKTDVEIDLGNTGLVDDVQVNGTSVVTNKVANIPVGTSNVLGVYKVNPNQGISAFSAGDLCVIPANENELIAKTQGYKPIVPNTLDKAIREGLGNNSLTWTDEYKSNARNTIGATQVVLKDW